MIACLEGQNEVEQSNPKAWRADTVRFNPTREHGCLRTLITIQNRQIVYARSFVFSSNGADGAGVSPGTCYVLVQLAATTGLIVYTSIDPIVGGWSAKAEPCFSSSR
jgi:hypothetical protein